MPEEMSRRGFLGLFVKACAVGTAAAVAPQVLKPMGVQASPIVGPGGAVGLEGLRGYG